MRQSQAEAPRGAAVTPFGGGGLGRLVAAGLSVLVVWGLGGPADCRAQVLAPRPSAPPDASTAAPAPASSSAAPAEEPFRRVGDLTTRYRFVERYTAGGGEGPASEVISQSRIGIIETISTETDKPRGAPERTQIVAQTIYTERPAELGQDGQVTATVRRYDAFRLTPDRGARPGETRPLEGLSIWYQIQAGTAPLVLCLTDNRRMREPEFTVISRQTFLPELSAVLPTTPTRIGDRWRVPRNAARGLVGRPLAQTESLMATLKELRTTSKGPQLVAIISVTGAALPFNAEIQFTFTPASAPVDDSGGSTVEARGAITDIRSAMASVTPLPGSSGRLRQTQTRELIMARQRDSGPLLTIPIPKPTPSEANSWLTYVDPRRRFHFQHPQALVNDSLPGADSVELIQPRPDFPDVVGIQIQPKTGDAEADRRNLDPELHRKTLEEMWKQEQQDVIPGASGWLPETDWKAAGLKVHRFEAALRLDPGTGRAAPGQRRAHLDYYLILTNRPESLVVTARTVLDPPTDFRKQVEAMIKTFRFGPPEK